MAKEWKNYVKIAEMPLVKTPEMALKQSIVNAAISTGLNWQWTATIGFVWPKWWNIIAYDGNYANKFE